MYAPTNTPTFDKEAIKARLDCCEVFERYTGLQGKAIVGGRQYSNPFVHQETGSFTVYPEKGYHDFTTGDHGGDVFALIAFLHKLDPRADFPRVLEIAADLAGYTETGAPTPRLLAPKPAAKDPAPMLPPDSWQDAVRPVWQDAQAALWSEAGSKSLQWLRGRIDAGRGYAADVIDTLIRSCGVGYLPDNRETGQSDAPIRVWSGLLFPYFDAQGTLTALQVRPGRAAGKVAQSHKYLFVSGSKPTAYPFIAGAWIEGAPTVITESVIKALAIKLEHPDWNCIGVGSAVYSLPDSLIVLLRGCPVVYLAMDNDPNEQTGRNPGQEANARLAAAINAPNVRLCVIPFGKDPDGYISQGGQLADLFAAAIAYTMPPTRRTLSNNERRALNRYAQAAAIAPTIELFIEAWRADLIDPSKGVTLAELHQHAQTLNRNTSAATIKRGLSEGAKWGYFECTLDDSTGGRPAKRYTTGIDQIQAAILKAAEMALEDETAERDNVVPTPTIWHVDNALADENPAPDEIHPDAPTIAADLAFRYADTLAAQPNHAARYEYKRRELKRLADSLKDIQAADLPADAAYKNARGYKAAFLGGLVDSGQLTDWYGKPTENPGNKRLSAITGVSERSIKDLAALANLDLKPQTAERRITDPAYLENPPTYDKRVKGALRELRFADGSGGSIDNQNVRREAVARASMGEAVTGVYRVASKIEKITTPQPAPLPEPVKTTQPRRETVPPLPRGLRVLLRLAVLAGVARRMGDDLQDLVTGEYAPLTARNVIGLLQCEGIKQPYQFEAADAVPLVEVEALPTETYNQQPTTADVTPLAASESLDLAQWLTGTLGGSVQVINHADAKRAIQDAARKDANGLEGVIEQLDQVSRRIVDQVLADPQPDLDAINAETDQIVQDSEADLRQIEDYLSSIRHDATRAGHNAFNAIRAAIRELDRAAVDLLRGSSWAQFVPDGAAL